VEDISRIDKDFVASICGCRREVIYIRRTFMSVYVRVREGTSLSRREVSLVSKGRRLSRDGGRRTLR